MSWSTFLSGNESETFVSWASTEGSFAREKYEGKRMAKEIRYMPASILQSFRTC